MTAAEVKVLLRRPIAFHRVFVDVAGSVTAGLMLSQAFYWSQQHSDAGDGWFFKTAEDWHDETGLTRWEQEGAREKLRGSGVWEEDRIGKHGKLHIRVDLERLYQAISDALAISSKIEKPKPHRGKTAETTYTETTLREGEGGYTEGGASPLIERQAPYQPDPPAAPQELLPGDLHLQALRVFNENRERMPALLGFADTRSLIGFFEEILADHPGTTFPAAIWDFAEQDAREFTKRPTGAVPLTCLISGFRKGLDARAAATAKPAAPPVSLTPAQVEYLRREDEERREWIAQEREKARAAEEASAEERKRRAAVCVAAARRRYGQPRQPAGASR